MKRSREVRSTQHHATFGGVERRGCGPAATFLAPLSVESADNALRLLARWLLDRTDVRTVAEISRDDIEDFKVALAQRRGIKGQALTANTQRQRLRMLRMFVERIIEWDWPDAPMRNPIIGGDIPPRPEPLPKFLDDRDAAKVMAAARAASDPRDRLVVEVLARTGLRASELCDLAADAVVCIGDGHWLRVPVGKLRNDRFIPLHPDLVALLVGWCADNLDHIRAHRRLIADHRGPIDRHQVGRIVRRVARRAGVTAHPHQLRHTLATQAREAGMAVEEIQAQAGRRSIESTRIYLHLANDRLAGEYRRATEAIDAQAMAGS